MSDIEAGMRMRVPKTNPRAPQGPSDEELNRVPPDPILPPFGGSASLFADLVTGRLMDPGRATTILTFPDVGTPGAKPISAISIVRRD